MEYGGNKVSGSWRCWEVSICGSGMNIGGSGGSCRIVCDGCGSRNYSWNGVGSSYSESENGSGSLSKCGDGRLSGSSRGSKVSYGNRSSRRSRSRSVSGSYSGVSK